MLLHSGKAHRVPARQLGDRVFAVHGQPNDVAPRRVGKRPEDEIRVRFAVRAFAQLHNHMVVRYPRFSAVTIAAANLNAPDE